MPKLGQKKLLSTRQERIARAAFAIGMSRDQVAFAVGVTRALLDWRLLDQLRDIRPGRGTGKKPRYADPTPEEIQTRVAEIHRVRRMIFDACHTHDAE